MIGKIRDVCDEISKKNNNFTLLILFNLGGRRFHPENHMVYDSYKYIWNIINKEVTYFVLNLFDDSLYDINIINKTGKKGKGFSFIRVINIFNIYILV